MNPSRPDVQKMPDVPAMGVNTWAAFIGSDERAVVDGDFAMLEKIGPWFTNGPGPATAMSQ